MSSFRNKIVKWLRLLSEQNRMIAAAPILKEMAELQIHEQREKGIFL